MNRVFTRLVNPGGMCTSRPSTAYLCRSMETELKSGFRTFIAIWYVVKIYSYIFILNGSKQGCKFSHSLSHYIHYY